MNIKKWIYKIGVLIVGIIAISTAFILAAPNITLTGSTSDNTATLTWTNSDTTSSYTYRTVRSINGGEYNGLSATGAEKIKVLNIHPNVSTQITFTSAADNQSYTLTKAASLKMWMEQANSLDANGYGRGLITVDPVSMANFNSNPGAYLYKDANGKYNYDVIMFGTWDSNNSEDLTETSLAAVKAYIEAGYGTIFGHDTINKSPDTYLFGKLQPYANAVASSAYVQTSGSGTCNVVITKNGTFTTYPWNIGTEGTVLTVPQTHAWSIDVSGDIWLSFEGYEYNKQNFYLTTYNNCAIIQTGHSSGAATEDEQKILANLIFYMADLSTETKAEDKNFVDINIPNVATLTNNSLNGVNGTATITATDNGTTYKYYVEATEKINQTKTSSNIVTQVRTTGVAGYSYIIDNNATTDVDNTIDTTSTNINYTLGNGPKTYLHIKTIDNAGNVSGVTHILLHDNVAPEMTLTPDITTWTNTDVVISATATDTDGSVVSIKKPDASVVNIATTTYTVSQNGKYSFTAIDNSGAIVTKEIDITWIDKVKPEGESTGITQPTATNRYAVINFKATDDASGVAKIVLPDGKEVTSDTVTFNVTTPGTYTFKVIDVAGNEKEFEVPVTIVSDGLEVKFIDQVTNEEIATKQTKTGNIGDAYTTTAETVAGYELVKTPDNKDGNLTMDKITVTYEYRKNSNVTVKYIDENYNTNIIENIVTKYKEGDLYETEEKSFDGYKLTGKNVNTSGTVEREDIEVVYKYKKVSSGVDTKFIDQVTGGEIAEAEHKDGLEKDSYTTTPKTIEGYELVLTPDNAKGEMAVDLITVTYEYRKNSNVTVKYIDENYNTNIIEDIVTKYKEGDAYTTENKVFDGYRLTSKTTNT
ncbi:MAG: MucBP domain-containing protein, partial [Clostridia bacterium]|nr:MucBP domain-containing protein [Clostridia bacterium]